MSIDVFDKLNVSAQQFTVLQQLRPPIAAARATSGEIRFSEMIANQCEEQRHARVSRFKEHNFDRSETTWAINQQCPWLSISWIGCEFPTEGCPNSVSIIVKLPTEKKKYATESRMQRRPRTS
jgi:hypothetical protein